MERSIDVSNPVLAPRLRLALRPAQGLLTSGSLDGSLFGSRRSKSRSVTETLLDAGDRSAGHGTLVAQIVGADLPDVEIGPFCCHRAS